MIPLKVIEIDGELMLEISEEARQRLDIVEGDTVCIDVSEDGVVLLTARDFAPEARRVRGQAFCARYEAAFEMLNNSERPS